MDVVTKGGQDARAPKPLRILVLGNSGSGKSTLAARLGRDLGIECFHMDRLFWKPGWQESSDEELLAKVNAAISGDSWVIDGNYSRSRALAPRLQRATHAIVLEVPIGVCLLRVCKRWWQNIGRVRADMGEGCREKWLPDFAFLKWIVTWPKRKVRTYALLAQYHDVEVIVLSGKWKYEELVEKLRAD